MEIGSLPKLKGWFLLYNNFTGEIPTSLWNHTSLNIHSLHGNNLEASVPEDTGWLKKLAGFGAGANKLSGEISSSLYNLSSLTFNVLALNKFSDSLPANMFSNVPNLQLLDIEGNRFSGHIPKSIANATMLVEISEGESNFVGKLSNLENLHDLSNLEFGNKSLGSNSSKNWTFLNCLSNGSWLTEPYMDINKFGGHLPNTLGNLSTEVKMLTLGQNQICGRIPVSLGNLINLMSIDTEMNYLTSIITITFRNFQKMQELHLQENKLAGEVFRFIGNHTQLLQIDLSDNKLEGNMPPTIRNCGRLQYLDLSLNRFSGIIPVQLITLSSLSILLNLPHDSFSGDISNDVGNFKNVGLLDVSHNHLTRNIPQTI